MTFKDFFKSRKKEVQEEQVIVQPTSAFNSGASIVSPWTPILNKSFDGEKTPGEMGNVVNLFPDHNALRLRSYEANLKSDVVKIITGKFFKWVVGGGLTAQAQPNEKVLFSEGITEDFVKFRSITEARFDTYANSKMSDFSGMVNLHKKASQAFETAFLGGDCLVVLRVKDANVTVQVIDGQEVHTPFFDSKYHEEAKSRGNIIRHGIEIAPNGEHVAFYVAKDTGNFLTEHVRIEAKSKQTGRLMAWMLYGAKHRINHHRGIPQISAILEKVEKLDRYTESTVGGAEERANIVFAIEHSRFSTGESPVIGTLKKNLGGATEADPYELGEKLEKNIAATTSKQTFNLPIGSKLTTLSSNQENQYPAFFESVFVQLCAANDIPPEVALQKYSSNYSASRAAINGWGYIVDIYRDDFSYNFYRNVYNLWLEVQIIISKIPAPGYLKAIYDNNLMAIEAYTKSKFIGVNMPHIDPLKEVKAVRAMLGDETKGETPLISYERATQILNQGEWSENYLKYLEEEKTIEPNETKDENNDQSKKQPDKLA